MNISAHLLNRPGHHTTSVETNGRLQNLSLPLKAEGPGSDVNGGELLFLALATCYCNDIYREAKKRGIEVAAVRVETSGEFGGAGEPARSISYRATVDAKASREAILELMHHTDTVAEIHNTLRLGMPVVLTDCEANEV
jgi:organic hydroperoxide reductase OsmC/OhrA